MLSIVVVFAADGGGRGRKLPPTVNETPAIKNCRPDTSWAEFGAGKGEARFGIVLVERNKQEWDVRTVHSAELAMLKTSLAMIII